MTSSEQEPAGSVTDQSKNAKMAALMKEAASIGRELHASGLIVAKKEGKKSITPTQKQVGVGTVRSNA